MASFVFKLVDAMHCVATQRRSRIKIVKKLRIYSPSLLILLKSRSDEVTPSPAYPYNTDYFWSSEMAIRYGLPYFLEDKTGQLSGSDFVDLYERIRLEYKCTVQDDQHTVYVILDTSDQRTEQERTTPVVTLTFGSNNTLDSIIYASEQPKEMDKYLSQVNIFAGSKLRRFFASDGNEYRWGYRCAEGNEWTCTNKDAEIVSHYDLKLSGEPPYYSSGCMLTVLEDYGHLAYEMLATNIIMRHIVAHDL